jgi:hypothetical protein
MQIQNRYTHAWSERLHLFHLGFLESPAWEVIWDDDSDFNEELERSAMTVWQGPAGHTIQHVSGFCSKGEAVLVVTLTSGKIFSLHSFFKERRRFASTLECTITLRENFNRESTPIRSWRADADTFASLYEGAGSLWETVWHWTETRIR